MTGWLWVIAVGIGFGLFGLGIATATMWRVPEDRAQAMLGVVFGLIALVIATDIVNVQVAHRHTVICNTATLEVLRARSDARAEVDDSTRRAQYAMSVVLSNEEHHITDDAAIDTAARTYAEAAEDRASLDKALSKPYPDCR